MRLWSVNLRCLSSCHGGGCLVIYEVEIVALVSVQRWPPPLTTPPSQGQLSSRPLRKTPTCLWSFRNKTAGTRGSHPITIQTSTGPVVDPVLTARGLQAALKRQVEQYSVCFLFSVNPMKRLQQEVSVYLKPDLKLPIFKLFPHTLPAAVNTQHALVSGLK